MASGNCEKVSCYVVKWSYKICLPVYSLTLVRWIYTSCNKTRKVRLWWITITSVLTSSCQFLLARRHDNTRCYEWLKLAKKLRTLAKKDERRITRKMFIWLQLMDQHVYCVRKKKIENKEIKILPLFCSSLISTVFS